MNQYSQQTVLQTCGVLIPAESTSLEGKKVWIPPSRKLLNWEKLGEYLKNLSKSNPLPFTNLYKTQV